MRQPPDPEQYNMLVWQIVRQIPAGKVSTYGQIASMIPPPDAVPPPAYKRFSPQWVGGALNICPDEVPWQRVINSKGMISIQPPERQRELLEAENVQFDARDRVDFKVYGWDGPDDDFILEHNLFRPKSLKKEQPGDASQLWLL